MLTIANAQKTYDAEETAFMSDNYDAQKSLRISQLEALVDSHKTESDALRIDVKRLADEVEQAGDGQFRSPSSVYISSFGA